MGEVRGARGLCKIVCVGGVVDVRKCVWVQWPMYESFPGFIKIFEYFDITKEKRKKKKMMP